VICDCRSGRMALRTAAAAALVLLPTGALSAQGQTQPDSTGTIRGRVTSETGSEPVEDARIRVELPDGARVLRTDSAGEFRAGSIPSGARPIEIQAPGFERKRVTGRVPAGGTLRLELRLTPAPRQARRPKTVGRVVASDGSPLSGVAVRADGTYMSTVTGSEGQFRMDLPESAGRLRFSRIGYRTRTVDLPPAERTGSDTLRVTLVPRPVELKGITVEGRRLGGVEAQALGQTVTTETVRQAPALGEPDLFRALVYLPNVSQPNDLKGRIHLAGGSSDETGYRLDGHPLQEPFHLFGLLGSFNVAALERADVRLHRYPVSDGGRLSGLIDMRTRRAEAESSTEAVGSLLSSSLTTVRPEFPGEFDLLASGRVTYLDRVAPLIDDDLPQLGYYDGVVRLGRSWDGGWRAELLGFSTRNHLSGGTFEDVEVDRDPLTWGESMAGLRLRKRSSDWRILLRGSFDRATTDLYLDRAGGRTSWTSSRFEGVSEERIDATRDWSSAEATIERRADWWRATGGVSLNHRRHDQSWRLGAQAEELFLSRVPETFSGSDELTRTAAFGEISLDVADGLSMTGGARAVRSADSTHVAPRALLSYEVGSTLALEASASRRLQFDAEVAEPPAGSVTPPRFLLDSPRRADLVATAVEWTPEELPVLDTEGRLRVVGFWKRYPDRPLFVERDVFAVPREQLDFSDFPRLRRVEGRSVGASAALRFRIGDRGLFQGSYTYQHTREKVEGKWSPTTWSAPHDLSLFTSAPVFGDLTLNGAYRLHSGRPVTPIAGRVFTPGGDFGSSLGFRFLPGERNSARLGAYSRLDVGLRHRFDAFGGDAVLFAQVLNLFWSRNPFDVTAYHALRLRDRDRETKEPEGGLPIIPTVGLEVSW